MDFKAFYLVQNIKPRQLPFIYLFENDGKNIYVSILQNDSMQLQKPLLIGSLQKHNKRGYTIQTTVLSDKPINLFLSNSDFQRFHYKEYKNYIEERKINA